MKPNDIEDLIAGWTKQNTSAWDELVAYGALDNEDIFLLMADPLAFALRISVELERIRNEVWNEMHESEKEHAADVGAWRHERVENVRRG